MDICFVLVQVVATDYGVLTLSLTYTLQVPEEFSVPNVLAAYQFEGPNRVCTMSLCCIMLLPVGWF